MELRERIKYLVEQLNTASDAYYGGKAETMSNFEWDALFDELELLEKETGYILPNSPTHHISRSKDDNVGNPAKQENHEYPALSLAKTKDVADLVRWADTHSVWVSWKLDGLTLVLTYDNGELKKILTRGDGRTGTNITFFKECIKGFPQTIKDKGHIVVRGEAIISYKDFDRINQLSDNYEEYANPRNLAAGTLSLDPSKIEIVKQRNVTFIAFSLVHIGKRIVSWGERMKYLSDLGFCTVEREESTPQFLPDVVKRWSQKVNNHEIDVPVDGLVITYDDTDYAATGSVTGHHATRGGLAYKWQDQIAITTLRAIEWSCATSVITPIAVFDPVRLEGTMVSRASLCNISEVERLGIGENEKTILKIIKANKIIPKCVGVAKTEGSFVIPSICPVCNASTVVVENKTSYTKVLQCSNPKCPAKKLSRFVRFTSKLGVNIDGLSIKTIAQFINKGLIKEFHDIFYIGKYSDVICTLDGFGKKSTTKLLEAVEKSKQVNAINFIYSLSIPLIGIDAAKRIVNTIGYEGFVSRVKLNQHFCDVSGIGEEKTRSINDWFASDENMNEFIELTKILNIYQEGLQHEGNMSCKGLTIAITGSLSMFKNRNDLIHFIEERGGKVTSSVSAKTDYLINNDHLSRSAKNVDAIRLGIQIISEKDFFKQFY